MSAWTELIAGLDIPDGPDDEQSEENPGSINDILTPIAETIMSEVFDNYPELNVKYEIREMRVRDSGRIEFSNDGMPSASGSNYQFFDQLIYHQGVYFLKQSRRDKRFKNLKTFMPQFIPDAF